MYIRSSSENNLFPPTIQNLYTQTSKIMDLCLYFIMRVHISIYTTHKALFMSFKMSMPLNDNVETENDHVISF